MLKVALLGSTGSIGAQALDILQRLDGVKLVVLAAGSNYAELERQIALYNPEKAALACSKAASALQHKVSIPVAAGIDAMAELAAGDDVDLVINAVVGAVGLIPTLAALASGKRVALANKETLVVGGALVMQYKDQIIPIDSEHSALWQCLLGRERSEVAKLVLTASGGPFRSFAGSLEDVTAAQALRHPNWDMGGKISIDSATLMNKGLEVIEAHWLFEMSYDDIDVVIHPQSIIHSLVMLKDGAYIAHLGAADMRLPIQYALTYPKPTAPLCVPLDLTKLKQLTFEQPDWQRFPCLALAYEAGRAGRSAPLVLNAANEVAVELFLQEALGFMDIPRLVETMLASHQPHHLESAAAITALDQEIRIRSREAAGRF